MVKNLIPSDLNSTIINWTNSNLTNGQQKVITPNSASAISVTSTCSPQGRMLSSILFSIYTDQIRSLSGNIRIIKFTDEPLVQELLHQHQQSELQSTNNNIYRWCQNQDLLIKAGKTKALTISNCKDNPVCSVPHHQLHRHRGSEWLWITWHYTELWTGIRQQHLYWN